MSSSETVVDVSFPIVEGLFVPVDHGHQLLGAIKVAVPQLAEMTIGIHPLRGTPMGQGMLHLKRRAPLRLRLPADRIAAAVPLAGKELRVGSMLIRLGSPSIDMIEPHAELYARTVVVVKTGDKPSDGGRKPRSRPATEAELIDHIKEHCNATATVRVLRWRNIRIHNKGPEKGDLQIRGAEVVIEGLDAEHSLAIQATGIGGRRAFGCGIFVKAGVRKAVEATATTGTEKGTDA